MRAELLDDLIVIGYEISLDGDHIRLHYWKTGDLPAGVAHLIDELRSCKPEAIDILKAKGNIKPINEDIQQPPRNSHAQWPADMQVLIAWFIASDYPVEPFYLEPHQRIIDPHKFCQALMCDIQAGPHGPRARTGALQSDLANQKARLSTGYK